MASLYKTTTYILASFATLCLLTGCEPVGDTTEEAGGSGAVSTSTSSSETGAGFVVVNDATHSHAASVVIGQADFTSSADKTTAADTLSYPVGNPTVVDGMLYLPDLGNYRAIGYNSVPTLNGRAANFAVGQANLVDSLSGSNTYRNKGVQTLTVYKGKLFLTDRGNSRILIYNQRPIAEPAKADIVIGQTDFDLSLPGLDASHLYLPESLYVSNDKLIVADSKNNRILIWNSIPAINGKAADIVLGQNDFTSSDALYPPTASSLNFPTAVWSNGTYLAVLDAGNNRILIWNGFPTTSTNKAADVVLGQPDFSSNQRNRGLSAPSKISLNFGSYSGGLYCNSTQLFVADSGNNRVLIWNFPIALQFDQAAIGLIGQEDYSLYGVNRSTGVTGQNTLTNPTGVYQFYNKLLVTDTGNNRYLIFNSL